MLAAVAGVRNDFDANIADRRPDCMKKRIIDATRIVCGAGSM